MWSSWSAWKVGKFLMKMEEDGAPTPPKQAADIAVGQRVSEAWIDFSDKSSEESRKGQVGYKKAVPRASARYALNPGLFDLDTRSSEFTQLAATRLSSVEAYTSPPQSLDLQGTLPSDDSFDTPFMDFDEIEAMRAFASGEDLHAVGLTDL